MYCQTFWNMSFSLVVLLAAVLRFVMVHPADRVQPDERLG
jgi:hypothetical protein